MWQQKERERMNYNQKIIRCKIGMLVTNVVLLSFNGSIDEMQLNIFGALYVLRTLYSRE